MVYFTNRSGANPTPFAIMADELYPEKDQQNFTRAGSGQDAKGQQDNLPGDKSTPLSDMADKVYPTRAQGEDITETAEDQDSGSENGEQDDASDADQEEPMTAAQGALNRMHAVMRAAGLDSSAKLSEKDAAGIAKLEAMLRKEIAGEEAKRGGPLTSEEEQNVTGEFMGDHLMKWMRLRNIGAEKLSESMWKDAGREAKSNCGTFFNMHFGVLGGKLSDGRSHSVKNWGGRIGKERIRARQHGKL